MLIKSKQKIVQMSLIKHSKTAITVSLLSLTTIAGKPSLAAVIDFNSWNSTADTIIPGKGQVILSSSNATDADGSLQEFLGLNSTDLDIGGEAFEGSALTTNITVNPGDELSFTWNFLTNETAAQAPLTPLNDYAFISINDVVTKLADVNDATNASSIFASETGENTYINTFTEPGNYQIGIGVVNVDDFNVPSSLQISNAQAVPEPLTILGSAIALGFGAILRHKCCQE